MFVGAAYPRILPNQDVRAIANLLNEPSPMIERIDEGCPDNSAFLKGLVGGTDPIHDGCGCEIFFVDDSVP